MQEAEIVKMYQTKCLLQFLLAIMLILSFHNVNCVQGKCEDQQKEIQGKLSTEEIKTKFVTVFAFVNETKPLLLMTWATQHTLIVVTIRTQGTVTRESDVYRSTDDGRTFERITGRVAPGKQLLVMPSNGLQRNPTDPSRIYLACYDPESLSTSLVYYTKDSGATWSKASPGFLVQAQFQFHPTLPDLLLAQTGSIAHVSSNAGQDWRKLLDGVFKVSWGVGNDSAGAIYAAVESPDSDAAVANPFLRDQQPRRKAGRQLMKTVDKGANWKTLAENIYSYSNKEGFFFISKADSDNSNYRHLEVSIDFGATFHRTHLPSATPDKFFAILDMSDGLAFVHMDAGNYLGYGTLYTSDSQGRVFAKSLERHLYPPLGSGSDFYKVESMRGTFLTTVLHEDKSMHSVVTHNRGGSWQQLSRPDGAACDATKCSLQVASQYSISRGVQAYPPTSAVTAAGLLILHGHAAANLQSNASDVYVSSDGGYSYYKALSGPHRVQIGNNGNFLVAVQLDANAPQDLKFSMDAGRCWHSHRFTDLSYTFTGLLTEPGNRALTASIWGFHADTHQWRVFVVDLGQLLTRQCTDSDYESWLTNGAVNTGNNATQRACILGAKETIKRLKPESMCSSDYSYTPSTSVQSCNCTKEDFECEFGYTRPVGTMDCVRDTDVQVPEICDGTTVKKIVTDGYRKLPGNRCQGGFQPVLSQQFIIPGRSCPAPAEDPRASEGRRLIQMLDRQSAEAEAAKSRRAIGFLAPLAITVAVLLGVVLTLVVLARLRERRRRQLAFHYSVVSATGRRADANGGDDLEYQPADGILNGGVQRPLGYKATAAAAAAPASAASAHGKKRGGDKQQLLAEDDDAPIF